MIRIIHISGINWYNPFPYEKVNDRSFIESLLFCPDDPSLDDYLSIKDNYRIVFDFDGFKSWFDIWKKDDEIFSDSDVYEYLSFHLRNVVSPVRSIDMSAPYSELPVPVMEGIHRKLTGG